MYNNNPISTYLYAWIDIKIIFSIKLILFTSKIWFRSYKRFREAAFVYERLFIND